MAESIVYLNGDFIPLDQAKVSVLDRGFIFGDGVYELIPVFCGKLFRLEEHLVRLNNSLNSIRIINPFNELQWQNLLQQLIDQNESGNLSVYLQITRGVAARNHVFPESTTATVFLMTSPLKPLEQNIIDQGISAITLQDSRWQHCNIKAISLLPNILMRQQAADKNAAEAILIKNNFVTEGAASNVFIVKHQQLYTPSKSPQLLPGVTRDLVVELALQQSIEIHEQDVPVSMLNEAEEIWITSSTRDIVAVTILDGKQVASGKPGKMWHNMFQAFKNFKDNLCP